MVLRKASKRSCRFILENGGVGERLKPAVLKNKIAGVKQEARTHAASKPVVKALGLEWYGWHGFRRGIAPNLYELGADEKIVQRILRHAKLHVTKDCHIKAFDPAVLAAMKRLEASFDVVSQSAPDKLSQLW